MTQPTFLDPASRDEAIAQLQKAWTWMRTEQDRQLGVPADESLYRAECKRLIGLANSADATKPVDQCNDTAAHGYPPQVVTAVADVLQADIPTIGDTEPFAHSVLSAIYDVSRIHTMSQLQQLPPQTHVKTNRGALRWAEYVDALDLPATVLDWGSTT